ncbi:MAG: FtsX-like permease family protein [Acidobacteria bacterium]|nr:FtsX-like permease family protein [Acidobacteriota bacterium]
MRHLVRSLDPELPLRQAGPLTDLVDERLAPNRFAALLAATFAIVALLLAAVGIYGVLSFSVAHRTREIGIRMALGADRRRVLTMVLRDALVLALLGVTAGGLAAAFLGRGLASLLYDVRPFDLPTFAAVALTLLALTLLAATLPARRAGRVAPAEVLKGE